MSKLNGKVALITGASKGIGAGIARRLAAEGAKVVVNFATSESEAKDVVAGIEGEGGRAIAVRADVRNKPEVDRLIKSTIDHFGQLDIVVNNAGIYQFAKIEATTEALYRQQFDLNVLGPLLVTGAAAPFLAEGSSIINISSTAGRRAAGLFASYATSKHGVNGFTESIRQELGGDNIRVSVIEPGATETEIASSISDPKWSEMIQSHVSKDGAMQASDIAEAILFIVSLPRRANVSQILIRPTIDTAPM